MDVMDHVEIWPTLMLSEHYLKEEPLNAEHLLICGVKNLREHASYERVIQSGGKVDIVEPWERNLDFIRKNYPKATLHHTHAQCFCLECVGTKPKHLWPDAVLWLQGPEHAPRDEALRTLEIFRTHGAKVIAEMPHGRHIQGADGGNPWEEHVSFLYPRDFDPEHWRIVLSLDKQTKEDLTANNDLNGVRHLLVISK